MKRIGAGIVVIVVALTLVIPSAAAQNSSAWLTPKSPEPLESAGEVVLTVSMWRAGRVEYGTFDGYCDVGHGPAGGAPNPTCSDRMKKAHAPEDYTATSGELVFTTGGSKTITIPITNDDVAESTEAFTLAVWEEANADPCGGPSVCVDRSDSVIVRINDDESGITGVEDGSGSAAGGPAPNTASGAGVTVDPATPNTATRPSPNLQVSLPAGELRPGPGFELTSERVPGPTRERGGGGGSAWWLAAWLGPAAVGIGALAFVRRRRRWSSTQA